MCSSAYKGQETRCKDYSHHKKKAKKVGFYVQQKVVCIRGREDAGLEEGHTYIVGAVIEKGYDYRMDKPTSGIIVVRPDGKRQWPYIWDEDRFNEPG